jgi:hypothetical protein
LPKNSPAALFLFDFLKKRKSVPSWEGQGWDPKIYLRRFFRQVFKKMKK